MRFRILVVLFLAGLPALAQQNHYIYIQGENQQVFYVKKGADILSSSASGFLIIPKIQPGSLEFVIGFPKKQFPEFSFVVDIKSKDRGFALKNFEGRGWGLFDLQSLEVIMGHKIDPPKEEIVADMGTLSSDSFSIILASAVDDPRIRQTSLVYRESITPDMASVSTEKAQTVPDKSIVVTEKTIAPTGKDVPGKPAGKAVAGATASGAQTKSITKAKVGNPPGKKTKAGVAKTEADKTVVPSGEPSKTETAKTGTPPNDLSKTETTKVNATVNNPSGQNPSGSDLKITDAKVSVTGAETQKESKTDSISSVPEVPENSRKQSLTNDTVAMQPSIIKLSEQRNGNELSVVYIDRNATGSDTIRISITEIQSEPNPEQKSQVRDSSAQVPGIAEKGIQPKPVEDQGTRPSAEKPSVEKSAASNTVLPPVPSTEEPAIKKGDPEVKEAGTTASVEARAAVRTDCRQMASEKDMVSIRKKMIMMADEDEMIMAALKDIKNRCYSTERIQNLSYVFTTDQGRYKLFDAAYPYVYDPANYFQLERLLNDEYYINRFRALIKKN